MKKIWLTVGLLFSCSLMVWAQQGVFEFEETDHDFGNIKEGVKASKVFAFKNTGDAPIVISNVKASCGCTTPEWPREPVAPGETASIKAVYNSKNRPGRFYKTITITSNASESTTQLKIRGNVLRADGEVIQAKKEQPQGVVAVTTKSLSEMHVAAPIAELGTIEAGQTVQHQVAFKNTGSQPLYLQQVKSDCNCVTFQAEPRKVAPGQKGLLTLFYTPKEAGKEVEKVQVITNANKHNFDQLLLKGEVVEELIKQSPLKQDDGLGF